MAEQPETEGPQSAADATSDGRLGRLFDYTKFHIGIYISTGGGLVALIGLAGSVEGTKFLKEMIGSRVALVAALGFMAIAGFCGGVVASGATQCRSFEDLWSKPQGPYRSKLWKGEVWAGIEHTAFWISLALLAYSVVSAPKVWQWITS